MNNLVFITMQIKKAWMIDQLIQRWLKKVENKIGDENQKILLTY